MSDAIASVPTLVTLDVHDQPRLGYYLDRSADILAEHRIPATYFVPAATFTKYEAHFGRLAASHHVACHGLFHDENDGEPYDAMPPSVQFEYIREATDILWAGLGSHPRAFRAP